MLYALFIYQTTFALNIAMNSSRSIVFAQSVSETAPCTGDNEITVIPKSSFVNGSDGGGTYYLSTVQVSGLPTSCDGKDFSLSFYDSVTASSALPIYSFFGENNRVATVYNRVGYFAQGFQSSGTEASSDSGSFTVTFKTPVALATNVAKVTLESADHKDWAEASFASTHYHNCAVTRTGAAKCWGYNYNGQLGDNTNTQTNTPGLIPSLSSGVIQMSAGYDFTCALLNTGKVKCWGADGNGQLGNGAGLASKVPVDVSNLSGVSAITSGYDHTCALLKTGGVKCWGWNGYSQLGDGTTADRPAPVDALSSGAISIGAGHYHTCAVLSTGDVKCWGRNSNGQLGIGTTSTSGSGNVLNLGAAAIATAGGEDFNCILLATGSLQCAGRAYLGQLGFGGTTVDRNTDKVNLVTVSGITTAVAISAGRWHACALLSTGAVRCWGTNGNYQLGDNTTTQRNTPIEPSGLSSGFRSISASLEHTCAVLSTGAAKCWGQNANGQLGQNSYATGKTPGDVLNIP